jgi:sugar lactone lactonase YvrE
MTRTLEASIFARTESVVGEAPAWDSNLERLVAVDITSKVVQIIGPGGELERTFDTPTDVGAALPAMDGGWLLALRDVFARLGQDGQIEVIASVPNASAKTRLNDAKCDPLGRAIAGSMAYSEQPGQGSLFRLRPGPDVEVLMTSTTISNGLGWSPDGSVFYFIDSKTQTIAAFDYDPEGAISGHRVVVTVASEYGMPDGLCVDADGCLWVALFGGGAVHRYTADGRLDTIINLPVSQPTSCAFGGADGSRLFITSARHLLDDRALADQPLAGAIFVADTGASAPPATLWDHRTLDRSATA